MIWCAANPQYERCIKLAGRIEGISRHASVHAAGVVIAPGPLSEYVPVCTAPTKGAGQTAEGEDAIITQFEMGPLEQVGMLKMDMLGLKTLTVIHDAVGMIRERHGREIDMGHPRSRRSGGLQAAAAGTYGGDLPVRIAAGNRDPSQLEVRPVR